MVLLLSKATLACASSLLGFRVRTTMNPFTGAPPGLADPTIGPIVKAFAPRTTLISSIAMTGNAAMTREAIVGCSNAPSTIHRKFVSPRMDSPLNPLRLPVEEIAPVVLLSRSNTSRGRSSSISSRVMVWLCVSPLAVVRYALRALRGNKSERYALSTISTCVGGLFKADAAFCADAMPVKVPSTSSATFVFFIVIIFYRSLFIKVFKPPSPSHPHPPKPRAQAADTHGQVKRH